ncbi:T. brucei spp.-specific protein [Trypanosoma brucei gambiense DAL972]|uniref:T. brucei spp.-specific protein n=1 Tax=Trypanosoma brucei gambiense (strain MHOM/CI/86/DAL972) TaxID=679716 RepID=C9ZLX7_TRYB9|nr:T. brucei spp.-specific protein [Trypanosoma brucei gambiense DAL972]CBH10402.1 T. brucei spp.-specific protein [Trypanosoma brucei gambiense DAL972]|eukprot:XP_011772692.1 T. brucei spp.-specific protein [Trypanosoma brucei gambiense DAL972]
MGRKIYCQPVPLFCCSLLFMQWYPVTLMDASFLVTAITKQKKN